MTKHLANKWSESKYFGLSAFEQYFNVLAGSSLSFASGKLASAAKAWPPLAPSALAKIGLAANAHALTFKKDLRFMLMIISPSRIVFAFRRKGCNSS